MIQLFRGKSPGGDAQINPAIAHMVLIVPCTIPHSPGASFFIVVIRRHPFFCKKRVLHRPIGGGWVFLPPAGQLPKGDPKNLG